MSTNKRKTVQDLIDAKLVKVPSKLEAVYKGQRFTATLTKDGKISYNGEKYSSLSVAGGTALVDAGMPPSKGLAYRHVNGWTFWKSVQNNMMVPMKALRDQL